MAFNKNFEPFEKETVKDYKPESGEWITNRFKGISQVMPDEQYSVNSGSDVKKYDKTSLNPVVNTPLNALVIGTFWSGYTIQGVNDYDRYPEFQELDDQIISMVNDQINDLEYETFDNTLKAILWDSKVFGFSVAEMVFAQKDGIYIVEAIKTKPSFNFNIWVNEVDDIEKLQHTPSGVYVDKEDLPKFVIGTYPYLRDGNHYGTSMLKSVNFDVSLLEIMEEAQTRGVKMLSIRPLIHWYNGKERTKEQLADIESKIFNIESASVLSLPMNIMAGSEDSTPIKMDEIQVLEDRASSDGVALINDIIDMLTKRITRNLGLPDDLGFTSTGSGSFAKAKEEMDMFIAYVTRNQQYVKDLVNRQIIPAMVSYNFSSFPDKYRLPNLVFETIEEDNQKTTVETYKMSIDAGIIEKDEPFIREGLDYPPKEESTASDNIVITNDTKSTVMNKIKTFMTKKKK